MRPFRFVLIHWMANNDDFRKEAGRIPVWLHRNFGWMTELWAYPAKGRPRQRRGLASHPGDTTPGYPSLQPVRKELRLRLWPDRGTIGRWGERSLIRGLRREARRIDALMVIHLTPASLILGLVYRLHNPHGLLWLKCDGVSCWQTASPLKHHILRTVEVLCLLLGFDVVSAETPEDVIRLKQLYPLVADKILLLPNGHDLPTATHSPARQAIRENLVLSVGRIGAVEKDHALLVEGFARARLAGWRLALVGPCTDEFKTWLQEAARHHPGLLENIDLPGEISDEAVLTGWYQRAQIFCLTSHREGSSFALIEAASAGAFLVCTPVGSASFLTQGGTLGEILPDRQPDTLAQVLRHWASRPGELASQAERQRIAVIDRLAWRPIAFHLGHSLQRRAAFQGRHTAL